MKTMNHYSNPGKVIPFPARVKAPAYPNAARRRERFEKLLDYALTAAASAGLVTALLFLFTIL